MNYDIFRLLKDYIDENPDRIEKVTAEELKRNGMRRAGSYGNNDDYQSDCCCIGHLRF